MGVNNTRKVFRSDFPVGPLVCVHIMRFSHASFVVNGNAATTAPLTQAYTTRWLIRRICTPASFSFNAGWQSVLHLSRGPALPPLRHAAAAAAPFRSTVAGSLWRPCSPQPGGDGGREATSTLTVGTARRGSRLSSSDRAAGSVNNRAGCENRLARPPAGHKRRGRRP